jgi:hypothetical protein
MSKIKAKESSTTVRLYNKSHKVTQMLTWACTVHVGRALRIDGGLYKLYSRINLTYVTCRMDYTIVPGELSHIAPRSTDSLEDL